MFNVEVLSTDPPISELLHIVYHSQAHSLSPTRYHDKEETALHVPCDCKVLAELWFHHLVTHFMRPSDYVALHLRCGTARELNLINGVHSGSKNVTVQGSFCTTPLLFSCYPWIGEYYEHNEGGVQTEHKNNKK
jgi:hypothetical protein